MSAVSVPQEIKAPECPICLELPFDAVSGKCGHSVCIFCSRKVSTCPICKKFTTWTPNYALRTFVTENYPQICHEKAQELRKITPEGKLDTLKRKYADFVLVRNDFDVKDVLLFLDPILRWFQLPSLDFQVLNKMCQESLTAVAGDLRFSLIAVQASNGFMRPLPNTNNFGKIYNLFVRINGYIFAFTTTRKNISAPPRQKMNNVLQAALPPPAQ